MSLGRRIAAVRRRRQHAPARRGDAGGGRPGRPERLQLEGHIDHARRRRRDGRGRRRRRVPARRRRTRPRGASSPGYEGEPYLRISADGTVQENQRSPATYLNQDRYGRRRRVRRHRRRRRARVGRSIDDDGEIAWHDHRIHWMSPEPRDGAVEGEEVLAWTVPMTVDGTEVTVGRVARARGGHLAVCRGSPSGSPAGAGLAAAGWARRRSLPVAALGVLAGSVAASIAGWVEWTSQPEGVGASPAGAIVPLVGLVAALCGVGALLLRRPRARVDRRPRIGGSSARLGCAPVRRADLSRAPDRTAGRGRPGAHRRGRRPRCCGRGARGAKWQPRGAGGSSRRRGRDRPTATGTDRPFSRG